MSGLILLCIAAACLVASLIAGSEVWASVSLIACLLLMLGGVLAGYAYVGAWLWGIG